MTRSKAPQSQPDDDFERAFNEQQTFVASTEAVFSDSFFELVGSLEKTGLEMIGAGKLETSHFAEYMHRVFHQVVDLEMVPPLTAEQTALIAGKVATYGAMREVAASKKTSRARKPTDTKDAPTDKAKP